MITNKKNGFKRRRGTKSDSLGLSLYFNESFSGKQIHKICRGILRKIPKITRKTGGISTEKKRLWLRTFDRIFLTLIQLTQRCKRSIEFTDELSQSVALENVVKLLQSMTNLLSIDIPEILTNIVNSIPLLISILMKLENKHNNKRKRKKRRLGCSESTSVTKSSIKKAIQILSFMSMSTYTMVRVACIYSTTLLTKLDKFEMPILEDAFSTQISPEDYIDFSTVESFLSQEDALNSVLFSNFQPEIYRTNSRKLFAHTFSIFNFDQIHMINGSSNLLLDKGWLSKMLDDESPAVRFEIFMLIYELLKMGKIYQYYEFLESINEMVYDCFTDENAAIQSLISELIGILSKNFPVSMDDIDKILPSMNDSNFFTQYNILKVTSISYFGDSEALLKALSTILESPLVDIDKRLLFNAFSSAAANNSKLASCIIPTLFKKYYKKGKEVYNASVTIFLFWAIWKTPSIIKVMNFNLLLLYPVAKLNLSINMPNIRIRAFCKKRGSYSFEVGPHFYNPIKLNHSFGLYPFRYMKVKTYTKKCLPKKGLFISIGKYLSYKFSSRRTIIQMCIYGNSPIDSIFWSSINRFTSYRNISINKMVFFCLLKILISYLKVIAMNSRVDILHSILSLQFQLEENADLQTDLISWSVKNMCSCVGNSEFNILDTQAQYSPWPKYSKFNIELCKILNNKTVFCSCFIISSPETHRSIPVSYFTENYCIKKNYRNKRRCLLYGDLSDQLIEFKSLFCLCTVCRFNTYYQKSNPEYFDGSSKVIFSRIREIILNGVEENFYIFPCGATQSIPLGISFNVFSQVNSNASINQTVDMIIQTPQILSFENLDTEQSKESPFPIEGSQDILNEMDTLNFEDCNIVELYLGMKEPHPFNTINSRDCGPVSMKIFPFKAESRQVYVFPIAKDTLRISVNHLISAYFEHPISSPVVMNTFLVSYKGSLVTPISNIYSISIHPTVMESDYDPE
ncbi:hypothetical protein OJ253_261 [Cryptosporidium canis]|uniref:Uncharacterized protein n=1 Tax=Cryptosporidium canis TaxID=195482 RepID=A0A9D5DIV1_9CRYT|nr:hypothetical protein OJ253_261 [Cryptosporidium canis]